MIQPNERYRQSFAFIVQHRHKAAQEIVDITYQTVFNFRDQATWQDDVTIVIIKRVAD